MQSLHRAALAALLTGVTCSSLMAQPAPAPAAPTRADPYDRVGQAVVMPDGAPAAAHAVLSIGGYAEVIALDSGRTILVPVSAIARSGREIELSPAAAQELGLNPGQTAPVRVRAAAATATDLLALRAGKPAVSRADAPPALLAALRRKLEGLPPPGPAAALPDFKSASPPSRVTAVNIPSPAQQLHSGSGYYVQIAALSDLARAATVARAVGGRVSAAGRLHRVRLGPYPDQRGAQAARDAVAGRGYGDARIVRE